jgi:prolyl oligopeptidase
LRHLTRHFVPYCTYRAQLRCAVVCAVLSLLFCTVALAQTRLMDGTLAGCPPKARIAPVTDNYGNIKVEDPYRWLEDQTSPGTHAWIDAEHRCTEAALARVPHRDALHNRLAALYRTDVYSAPIERSGRYFFTKRTGEQDLSSIYMRRGRSEADEVLVDPLGWSKDHSVSAAIEDASRDGRFLFYDRREGGQDEVSVHVLDVDSRSDLPDVLPSAVYFSIAPTPDDRGVYYTKATANGPRAYYHAMGTDPREDKVIFGDGLGRDRILAVLLSDDGRYLVDIVFHGSGSEQTELYTQAVREHGPIVTVVNDIPAHFDPSFGGTTLYIRTNWQAPNWHVYATDAASPSIKNWREVIAESHNTLTDFDPIGGKLVAEYLHNAASEITMTDAEGKNPKPIPLPGPGSAEISGRWESPEVFYTFTSFNYPTANFVYDISTGSSSTWSKINVPLDPGLFEIKQVWYQSKDGTRVPMFLFYKKGMQLNGKNPTVLFAYGGFDVSWLPFYQPSVIAWAERGGIYALANIRGGGEYGEEWHRAGMLKKNQNVFDDFISAAEYLIANRYTNPRKLAISGESNGGLLVGAALTQRPDLFQAVVCLYPLLDMLRYQKFMDGPYWVPEYGSSDNPEQFEYLYKYSPYQNVRKGVKYPSVLFVTGGGDTRVAPLHARKMTAILQADTGSERPILLLYDTKSGHSGGRPVNKTIDEQTDILSYLLWQLDVTAQ